MIRLGRISYVNMAPVFYRLEAEVEEVSGVPAGSRPALARRRGRRRADSVHRVAANADRLTLLPRLCVSSEGAVDSIQLISPKPIEDIRTIAVTPESATSVVLTRILFPDASHVPLDETADAKLLIGDAALRSAFEDPTPAPTISAASGRSAPASRWSSPSGRAPEPPPDGVEELEDALVASVRKARSEPEVLAREAMDRYGYPAGFLARYFEKLRYRFGPRERAALFTFLELARDVGQLDRVPNLRFVYGEAVPA